MRRTPRTNSSVTRGRPRARPSVGPRPRPDGAPHRFDVACPAMAEGEVGLLVVPPRPGPASDAVSAAEQDQPDRTEDAQCGALASGQTSDPTICCWSAIDASIRGAVVRGSLWWTRILMVSSWGASSGTVATVTRRRHSPLPSSASWRHCGECVTIPRRWWSTRSALAKLAGRSAVAQTCWRSVLSRKDWLSASLLSPAVKAWRRLVRAARLPVLMQELNVLGTIRP